MAVLNFIWLLFRVHDKRRIYTYRDVNGGQNLLGNLMLDNKLVWNYHVRIPASHTLLLL